MSHRAPRRRRLPDLRGVLLTGGALLGVLGIVAVAAALLLGLRPLVVTSGSMSPTISAGSLVVVQDEPASHAEVGDVVAVDTGGGARVMHRVVATATAGDGSGRTVLTLQGDANATPDKEPYVVDRVGGVRAHVPWFGYPVTWLGSSLGLLTLGALACGLVLFAFRPVRSPAGRRRALAVVAAPVAVATVVGTTAPAHAWFDDRGTVTIDVSSHTVTSQAQPTCQNVDGLLVLGNVARLTWAQVDGKYEYTWDLQTTGGTSVASGTVGTGIAAGGTVTLDISTGLIGVNANYNVVVRARLAAYPTWVAATTTTTQVRRASILVIGAAMRCGWA